MSDARALYERMTQEWLSGEPPTAEMYTEDVVHETPFSPPGHRRIEGRDAWVAFATAGRAAYPVRFEEHRTLALHETADPDVIVVEYELTGVDTRSGRRGTGRFVGVLRVRDGRVAHWREYQDVLAMAQVAGV